MIERKELLRYSSCFLGPKENLEKGTRVILAELFASMSRAIMEERDFPVHTVKHISLVLETDLWDYKLVLILDRDDTNGTEVENATTQ